MKGRSMNIALASDIAEHVNNCSPFLYTDLVINQTEAGMEGNVWEEWDLSPLKNRLHREILGKHQRRPQCF